MVEFKDDIIRYKLAKCPIQWYCRALNKIISVSTDAIYHPDGWICECQLLVKCVNPIHKNIVFGYREMIVLKKGSK